ncbi:MAG: YicC family protein [Betaproteobacteria bacterium RIFCSPLOWO2_02_FULL_67_26]|nr:MAG: YicC family protein [Betaproteobacteria bacterium RIFCSPLOWO2_02_FULL_67_26]
MIHSMTGYATAAREFPFGMLSVELRSVNHRYLDIQFRLPDDLRAVEPALRELVSEHVRRGKVECRVSFSAAPGTHRMLTLNEDLMLRLEELELKIRTMLAGAGQLTVADVLRWPGMLATDPLPLEELQAACRELLAAVLREFNATRGREGDKLKALLLDRAAGMEQRIAETAPRIPQVVDAYRERLAARLREALGGGEDERIRQEVAVFAAKIDVDEEISRLTAHVSELKQALANGGAVGKKLDFLMQELNREANTLASKSVDLAVTRAALELKLLIEQMREQIQNIE